MRTGKRQVNVAIRLDARKHRRFRQQVVSEGESVQAVVERLIDKWLEERESGAAGPADLRGLLRDTDVLALRGKERAAELAHESRSL